MNHHTEQNQNLRVGVVFGGRSSEHEVSLASAKNVIDALQQAGYTIVPIGISPEGRWLTGHDPLAQLVEATRARVALAGDASVQNRVQPYAHPNGKLAAEPKSTPGRWDLLPRHTEDSNGLAALDVIFPVLHGPYGEDGTVQGLLEMANLPYVGCSVLTSALAMDKAVAKRLLAAEGIHQVQSSVVYRTNWQDDPDAICSQIEAGFEYPLFVKPANLGSSIGVSKARNRQELCTAIDLAAEYDRKIVVEAAVPHAREIEVSVLGNDQPIASIPGEVIPGHEFYDYEAKYIDDSSQLIIPASLTEAQVAQAQEMAVRAFLALDGSGLARVDFLMNGQTGEFFLNEINTMPGFTRSSMYPKLWEASGIPYPELVHRLVQLALARYEERSQNRTTR
jgi:D-alanine-D-alanine ligase